MLRRRTIVPLALFWAVMACAYVFAAVQQKRHLNLSAAAGGQHPYLTYAKAMADEGIFSHAGARNRMPLVPAVISLAYDDDCDAFADRAAWLAIALSLLVLAGVGWMAYTGLPAWPATAVTTCAVVFAALPKASFVQAELPYYGLLLASWLAVCRLIVRPDWRWAIAAGALMGLTYLTKASGAALLVAYGVTVLVQIVIRAFSRIDEERTEHPAHVARTVRRMLVSGMLVLVGFLAIAGPYLATNKSRFGRFFYNVNSTYFMWCDSWSQAKAFDDLYRPGETVPDAPPEAIPGPRHYWNTHTASQIVQRLRYGAATLASLAVQGGYGKYVAIAGLLCIAVWVRPSRGRRRIASEPCFLATFCALFFGGYAVGYAWYVPVAYGDRFILSLFLPAMFGLFWVARRLSVGKRGWSVFGRRCRMVDAVAILLTAMLLVEGGTTTVRALDHPSRTFIQFYYNESRALQQAGNLNEAAKGFAGVISLDPAFAAAHHGLGMIALTQGRFVDAISALTEFVRHSPQNADGHNSLGSALLQAGRIDEAVQALNRAVQFDAKFASAWFNLGIAHLKRGSRADAELAHRRLQEIDPHLARKLGALLEEADDFPTAQSHGL